MVKKVSLLILTSITVLILGATSYAFQFIMTTTTGIYAEIERNEKFKGHLENVNLENGDPISILIMGMDTRVGQESGRTDTLILVTINPQTNSTHMVSIPRDSYMKLEGTLNKINSAYQVGGTERTILAVETFLDVPVDYFIKINMRGFEDIINALGGVEVKNDLNFTYKNVHFPKGHLKLNGQEALLYARMRKKDPRGDFGRQIRQRQVIRAVIQKGASISSITKFNDMLKVIESNVRTNMSLSDMWKIQSNYKSARKHIKQHKIQGSSKTKNGTYYYMPNQRQLHKLSAKLKKHLELKKVKTK